MAGTLNLALTQQFNINGPRWRARHAAHARASLSASRSAP